MHSGKFHGTKSNPSHQFGKKTKQKQIVSETEFFNVSRATNLEVYSEFKLIVVCFNIALASHPASRKSILLER